MRFKMFMAVMLGAVLSLVSCGGKKEAGAAEDNVQKKIAVAYFSATGTTRAAAERIADLTGADLIEIAPVELYTDADLDWRDSLSRSSVEMHDAAARPEMDVVPALDEYDVIFVGYPNWWNTAPRIINTFIETAAPEGAVLVPFMTSGGGDILNSENDLHQAYPTIIWRQGLLMNNVTDEQINAWVQEVIN